MALTTAQQTKADELKAVIQELKDFRTIASSTLGNFGNGMVLDDLLSRIDAKIAELENS